MTADDDAIAKANLLYDAGDLVSARALVRAQLNAHPSDPDAHLLAAYIAGVDDEDEPTAIAHLKAAAVDSSRRPEAATRIGTIMVDWEDPADLAEGEWWLREGLRLGYETPQALAALAVYIHNSGDASSARATLQRAAQLLPPSGTKRAEGLLQIAVAASRWSTGAGSARWPRSLDPYVHEALREGSDDEDVLTAGVAFLGLRWKFVQSALLGGRLLRRNPLADTMHETVQAMVALSWLKTVAWVTALHVLVSAVLLPVMWVQFGPAVAARVCGGVVLAAALIVAGVLLGWPLRTATDRRDFWWLARGKPWTRAALVFGCIVATCALFAVALAWPGWVIIGGALALLSGFAVLLTITALPKMQD